MKLDRDLLLSVFKIDSPTGHEIKMQTFIKNFLDEKKIAFAEDKAGNIFNIGVKNVPLLSSHMDTVEKTMDSKLMEFVKIYETPKLTMLKGIGIIGGDDKCGVYTILHLLATMPKDSFNFVFSTQEESGCVGIRSFIESHGDVVKSNCRYGLILDRRGGGDIICKENNYGTKVFEDDLALIGKEFGFKPERGATSDADVISAKISCANLSMGYYNPHTGQEYVNLDELENTIEFVKYCVENLKNTYVAPEKTTYKKSSYGTGYGYDYDDGYYKNGAIPSTASCIICYKTTYSAGMKQGDLRYLSDSKRYICKTCAKKLTKELNSKIVLDWMETKTIVIERG